MSRIHADCIGDVNGRMPGVKRWLFNFTAAVALVVLLAFGALFMHRGNGFVFAAFGRVWWTSAYYDVLCVSCLDAKPQYGDQWPHWVPVGPLAWVPPMPQRMIWFVKQPIVRAQIRLLLDQRGLPLAADVGETAKYGTTSPVSATFRSVPIWTVPCAAATLPAVWLYVHLLAWHRKRMRLRAGQCLVCGYDLRATPERCPECGTIPSPAKGAAV